MNPERLNRSLSLVSLFTLAFGTMIGVGWITVLGAWLTDAGSLGAMLAFIVGGFMMLPVALCYAEIAGMYPVSGGEVAYVYKVYGERAAFYAGWLLAYSYTATVSFEVVSVGWVLSSLFPGLEGPVLYTFLGSDVRLWSLVAGLALCACVTAINYRGARSTSSFQTAFVLILVITTLMFILAGLSRGEPANFEPIFVGDSSMAMFVGVLVVFASTPFWYGGFDTIPQAMGEVSENVDLKRIARVMIAALVIAMLFYAGIILTASLATPRQALLGFDLPVATAAGALMGGTMRQVVLLAGLCGLLTTWNAMFYASTRVVFALARARMIPEVFARVHPRFGSPYYAVVFVGVASALGAFMGRQAIGLIVNSSAVVFSFLFALIVFGVIRLRRRLPHHPRPYRVPGGSIGLWAAMGLALCVLLIAVLSPLLSAQGEVPTEWILMGGWLLVGVFFYFSARKLRDAVSPEERRSLMLNET
ncbi:MAG: APC family permease [Pseudomonadota bacterium]